VDMTKQCETCKETISGKNVSNYFLSLSIRAQLKSFFSNENCVRLLQSHKVQMCPSDSVLSDICDGAVYKKHVIEGLLSGPNNFSYTFFTDGVAFGRSGKKVFGQFI